MSQFRELCCSTLRVSTWFQLLFTDLDNYTPIALYSGENRHTLTCFSQNGQGNYQIKWWISCDPPLADSFSDSGQFCCVLSSSIKQTDLQNWLRLLDGRWNVFRNLKWIQLVRTAFFRTTITWTGIVTGQISPVLPT